MRMFYIWHFAVKSNVCWRSRRCTHTHMYTVQCLAMSILTERPTVVIHNNNKTGADIKFDHKSIFGVWFCVFFLLLFGFSVLLLCIHKLQQCRNAKRRQEQYVWACVCSFIISMWFCDYKISFSNFCLDSIHLAIKSMRSDQRERGR